MQLILAPSGCARVDESLAGGRVRSMQLARFAGALATATLLATACASASSPPTPQPSPTAAAPAPSAKPGLSGQSSPVPASASGADGQQAVVDEAVRTAAAYAAVAPTDVQVQQVEAREWSDASLGCPRPGLMYSQVVTPGYLIVLVAAGRVLEYHSDARGRVVLCQER